MYFLSYLNNAQLGDIEDYLAWLPSAGNPERLTRDGDAVAGEALYRESCTGCHSMGTSARVGPDLLGHSENCASGSRGGPGPGPGGPGGPGGGSYCERLEAFIVEPMAMATHAYSDAELAQYPFIMPDLDLSDYDALDIATFIGQQTNPLVPATPVLLSDTEFEETRDVYFDRCAGCHGLYRTGATGPDIQGIHWDEDAEQYVPGRSNEIGTDGLGAILRYGTPAGMGNFGQSGILSEEQITNLAAYLQLEAPDAPPLPMGDIQASWDLVIPVASRPTTPEHSRNWENYTGVVLRDAGQVAIFDGDTNEEIVKLSTGFAVHILRSSSTGRYFYAIGRDGLVTMIDLWTTVPTIVANVKGCHDARSVDGSKFTGYEDAYIIEGCYWPPQYVVYDGLTLEPKQRVDVPLVDIDGAPLLENRIASIVASHNDPVWVVSQKEAGFVSVVDYAADPINDPLDLDFPIVANIPTAKFLHDGGFDHTGDYFLVAANASNKMVVVDLVNLELDALIDTGAVPHPGRGVNWFDPDYGWVNATSHIGEGKVTVYGADPVGRPDVAWQIVRTIPLPSSGSLFVKSHDASPWVLVDMTLSATGFDKDICAIDKDTGALANNLDLTVDPDGDGCFTVATNGKAVHFEFNMNGTEVMVSDWDPNGAVIVLDSTTLKEIRRFANLTTPTGKFNVYNTAHDIY